jgi:hypothetical protein
VAGWLAAALLCVGPPLAVVAPLCAGAPLCVVALLAVVAPLCVGAVELLVVGPSVGARVGWAAGALVVAALGLGPLTTGFVGVRTFAARISAAAPAGAPLTPMTTVFCDGS